MGTIPTQTIEQIAAANDIVEVIGTYFPLKRAGSTFKALCPFHQEKTPSFTVSPSRQTFHCFGCGAGGGPIDWTMKKNGVSFRHAAELLREGLPSITDGAVKHTTVRALPPPVSFDADDQALLDQVADYYHQSLKQSPDALA